MMNDPANFLSKFPQTAFRFRSPLACSLVDDSQGYLVYLSAESAGAVGKIQGEALLAALAALEAESIEALELHINSAGAHFNEPMEGLWHLNAFLEALWGFRSRNIRIVAVSDGWLYGGMAMALCAVAHEIRKDRQAIVSLFGRRGRP